MTSILITPDTFTHFGNLPLSSFKYDESVIANNTHEDDKLTLFKKMLMFDNDVNILQFHNLVFNLTNCNITQINTIIIEFFNELTLNIQKDFQDQLNKNQFDINYFIQIYNQYYSHGMNIMKHMTYFDKKMMVGKYSYISLIRNYTFYQNIINHKYDFNNNTYYLYELFNHLIESNQYTMENILLLYKMYAFYIRLSKIKTDIEMFNQDINKLFLNTLGSNENFIKIITHYIHVKIMESSNDTQNNTQVMEQNIINIIDLVSKLFIEKDLFNMHYEKFLEQRLLSTNCNCEMEERFISCFEKPRDNKIIQKMLYKLEDIKSNKVDAIIYSKIKINIGSDSKYTKVPMDHFHNIKFRSFRSSTWSCFKESEYNNMNVPEELEYYFDIYSKFCKKRYNYRNINLNFNYGVGVIKMNLGQKQYQIQLTIPQLFLLIQFNQKEKYTAIELGAILGIPMSKLAELLNGFFDARILARENNKQFNDPTMLIYLNQNFKCNNDNISIVSLMNTPKKLKAKQENNDADIAHQFAIERELVVQAALVRIMKKNKQMNTNNLLQEVKTICKFNFNNELFNKIMNDCINEKIIKQSHENNDIYEYIP